MCTVSHLNLIRIGLVVGDEIHVPFCAVSYPQHCSAYPPIMTVGTDVRIFDEVFPPSEIVVLGERAHRVGFELLIVVHFDFDWNVPKIQCRYIICILVGIVRTDGCLNISITNFCIFTVGFAAFSQEFGFSLEKHRSSAKIYISIVNIKRSFYGCVSRKLKVNSI